MARECLGIEHCIIGETFFFASSPPILGAFYNNEKKYFAYCYWTGYFPIMSKLNHLFNAVGTVVNETIAKPTLASIF